MGMSLEEMYKLALNPKIYPTDRLLKIMQGQDTSLPMAVAMSAKQMRDKQTTALKGAQAKAQGAQPSVKDRMLAQGMQQEMAGLDQLPAPTMEGMGDVAMGAGGGLVSFAKGGFNSEDDEDAEQDDHDELTAMAARYGDLGGLGAGIMSVANPKAAKFSSFTAPTAGNAAAPAAGNFKDIAAEATKKHGASWDLVQHVMQKETGGHKDPANAVSKAGATGVMQLMPRTAKELGVKNINDPYENINGGVRYIAQLEQKYKDPKLAAMAYNWGPGNVDKWLKRGGNEKSLPKETRMYVASLAQGGIVGLASGGTPAVEALLNAEYGFPNETEKLLAEEYGPQDKKTKGTKAPNKLSKEAADFLQKQAAKKTPIPAAPSAPASTIPNAPNMPGGFRGFLQKQAATLGIPGLIYEGGKNLGEGTMSTMAGNPYFENFSDPMSGDFAVGNQILQQNPGALAKAREEAPTIKTPAAKVTAPATGGTNTNTDTSNIVPTGDTKTDVATPVDPFASSQKRLDDYLANLTSQRKQDQGISAILGGLTTAGTAGPLTSALKTGAQTGLGYYGDAQKGYNAAMVQGLGAQSALDRNRVYQELYSNKPQRDLDAKYSGQLQKYNADITKEINGNALLKSDAVKADAYRKKRLKEVTTGDPAFIEWFISKGGNLGPQSIQLDTVPGNVIGAIKPK